MLDDVGVVDEKEDVVDDVGATVLEVEDVELELKLAAIRGFQRRGYHKYQLESAVQEPGLQHYM
jgi:hypothetical protein